MTFSYLPDHAGFETALISWLEQCAFLPGGSVRFGQQIGGRPDRPYGLITMISGGAVDGIDAEHQEYNAVTDNLDTIVYGPRQMTVQVEVFTTDAVELVDVKTGARNKMNAALAGLRIPAMKQLFQEAGLAFQQVLSGPREADEQLGARWERRMIADLAFGYTSVFSDVAAADAANWIETADDPIITSEV